MKVNTLAFLQVILIKCLVLLLTGANGHASASEATTGSKNILFYMGCGSYSMRISIWPLVEALTEKGHHVTFLSAYESKDPPHPRIHDFTPKRLKAWWAETEHELNAYELRKTGNLIPFWLTSPNFGIEVCKRLYEDSEVLNWVQKSKFDLIFVDSFMNECAYVLAHVQKAKTIVLSTTTVFPWFYDIHGIPDDSSWAGADCAFGVASKEKNFLERTLNAVMPVVWKFIREWWYLPILEDISKRGLKLDNLPRISDLEKNTSLTFVTTHYSQEFARAFPPNVVSVGGLALTEKLKPLPKDIEDFINKGKHGFVYISFGTVVEFSKIDKEVQDAFVKGVLQFPHIQFIWKSTFGVGVDLPDNFMVLKWAPQQSLLAHPKIKAFVTHAGLGGINEAIYFGVPMISFPVFAEQDYNANLLESKKIGVKLEILGLKPEHLQNAISQVTGSSRMKHNMLKVSKLFKDRPQTALQTSLWWTEYVLKYDASDLTEFLQPHNVKQSWWVRRQLDVWLFIFTVILFVFSLLLYILKSILHFFWKKLFAQESEPRNITKVKQQ